MGWILALFLFIYWVIKMLIQVWFEHNNIDIYDYIKEELSIKGTNYILLDKVLDPHQTDEIKLMLWTDYERIPNTMQDKYFYGTIRIYAWQELEQDNL